MNDDRKGGINVPFYPSSINDDGIAAGTDAYGDEQILLNVNSGVQTVLSVPTNGSVSGANRNGEFVGSAHNMGDFPYGYTGNSPPDQLTMATISEITSSDEEKGYNPPPVIDPSGKFENDPALEVRDPEHAFFANVYTNTTQNNDWAVVAFRGTQLTTDGHIDFYKAINYILADSSFAASGASVSTPLLDQVNGAVNLLIAVHNKYPNSRSMWRVTPSPERSR